MTHIVDSLYLGDRNDAFSKEFMSNHPTAILNCAKDVPMSPHGVASMHLMLDDIETERITPHFSRAIEFIEREMAMGRRVLVHCAAGISRSASMVIAYLMYTRGMSFNDAYAYVKDRRNIVNPNMGFVFQLHAFGEALMLMC